MSKMWVCHKLQVFMAKVFSTGEYELKQVSHVFLPKHGTDGIWSSGVGHIGESESASFGITFLIVHVFFIWPAQIMIQKAGFVLLPRSHSHVGSSFCIHSCNSLVPRKNIGGFPRFSTVRIDNITENFISIKANPLLTNWLPEKRGISMSMRNEIGTLKKK